MEQLCMKLKPATIEDEPPTEKWGSPEEIHRRLCFLVLAHRYLYYVEHMPVLNDHEYDLLERYLIHLERTTGMSHWKSPTCTVGSSQASAYPPTAREWASRILLLQVPRSVYFIEYLTNIDWKNYLNSLEVGR
jgi:hypothetical protein